MNEFNKVLLYSLYLSLFISLLRFPILANCTALTHTHTQCHTHLLLIAILLLLFLALSQKKDYFLSLYRYPLYSWGLLLSVFTRQRNLFYSSLENQGCSTVIIIASFLKTFPKYLHFSWSAVPRTGCSPPNEVSLALHTEEHYLYHLTDDSPVYITCMIFVPLA